VSRRFRPSPWARARSVPLSTRPDAEPLRVDGWTHTALPGLLFHQLPWLDHHTRQDRERWAISHHASGMRLLGELTAPTRAALVGACLDAEAHPRPDWTLPPEDLANPAALAWLLDVMACLDLEPPAWTTAKSRPRRMSGPATSGGFPATVKGFGTPPLETLEAWVHDSVCEALDGCTVEHDGTCPHGYPSWLRALGLV
jgi:hypothetical protein